MGPKKCQTKFLTLFRFDIHNKKFIIFYYSCVLIHEIHNLPVATHFIFHFDHANMYYLNEMFQIIGFPQEMNFLTTLKLKMSFHKTYAFLWK